MFVYRSSNAKGISILDTDDGVEEVISYLAVYKLIVTDGVIIDGIYYNESDDKLYDLDNKCLEPIKSKNSNLTKAKKLKNDEFYTQLSDIEKELSHYPIETFKDKVIYCPMDVATNTGAILQSQFVKYFQLNAHRLQFKKLIATCLVEKAIGDGVDYETAQNCYILERRQVRKDNTYIYSYTHGKGKSNPVVGQVDEYGLKYNHEDGFQHPVPYHVVNQAVTDAKGKIVIVKKYIESYNCETGKPVLCDEDKGLKWVFEGHLLSIKWCRQHPDGTIDPLPDECYFFNNNNFISDFTGFTKDVDGNFCYESVDGGSVCLYPPQYYDYSEIEYGLDDGEVDYSEYFVHCPSDTSEYGGSGDFRSEYCTKLLQECDIVVTNPPFSLFREFISWLTKADKKFITIGNQNAINYLCPLIKNNILQTGSQTGCISMFYQDPTVGELVKLRNTCWYTNIDLPKHHELMIGLNKGDYESQGIEYIQYDNYHAIEVPKLNTIPMDYDGVMGVPITYLYKHNPDQFDIIGITYSTDKNPDIEAVRIDSLKRHTPFINGKEKYPRVLIRHRKDENGRLI